MKVIFACLIAMLSVFGVAAQSNINGNAATAMGSPDGWTNLLKIGGVADGSFTGGSDNSEAVNSWVASAGENSVLYIPPGSYRFNSTITWPNKKRLFLISYGNLYFGTNNGFIIDGSGN